MSCFKNIWVAQNNNTHTHTHIHRWREREKLIAAECTIENEMTEGGDSGGCCCFVCRRLCVGVGVGVGVGRRRLALT